MHGTTMSFAYLDLGELVGSSSSHLGHTQGSELGLQVLELTEQLSLALGAQLECLDCKCARRCRGAGQSDILKPIAHSWMP